MSTVDLRLARPRFSAAQAAALLAEHFGLEGALSALPSERDQNFEVGTASGPAFVLKIADSAEDPGTLACQAAVLARLTAAGSRFAFPAVVPDRRGQLTSMVVGPDGGTHLVRVLRYVPGEPLASVRVQTPALLEEVGTLMGTMAAALAGVVLPCAERELRWDLRTGRRVIEQCLATVASAADRQRIRRIVTWFDSTAAGLLPALRTHIIHNDANDFNVLVSATDADDPLRPRHVTGIVDFGDLVHSYVVGEAAIAAAYAMLNKRDVVEAAAAVVRGFHQVYPLTETELAAAYPLACLRLCTSAVLSAQQRVQDPDNAYLSVSERAVWEALGEVDAVDPALAHYRLRDACGFDPCPQARPIREWLAAHADAIGPVLDPDPRASPRVTLDLSVGSSEWGGSALHGRSDAAAWAEAISARMWADGARVAIGRYDEPRSWYTAPQFAVATDAGEDWRTIHLGVDLFAAPGTPVHAPIDGVVEAVRDNDEPLDYGPTVVLRHELPGGARWYTLYGHLERGALALRAGQVLRRGERIGAIGALSQNGGWAPHLHLQLIADRLGYEGDFPGVARPAERAVWLSLSPDPNLLLQLPEGCRSPERPEAVGEQLLAARRARIAPSLSIAYRAPLTIVRGWMQHLYDVDGRAYLDGVNNVAHVGHCHPHVVAALRRQAGVLNTNTRYLHPMLVEYAERLTAHLPEPLRVCFFVCSGSEANELALRLARAHTGRRGVVVVDHAYHGNTSALVDVSPYKFNGPGGAGAPPHVGVVAMPDPYRGRHRGYSVEAGRRYAAGVGEAIADLDRREQLAGAFIAEAINSGGGQVEPPAGFLAEAYRIVRAAGGVCIADEVQIGFGRVGTHFWGFETQGVAPDIVTLGKPIGNGHPLGAVVTTAAIAGSFANGMEYFNTFGGNPVSCAVGLAVLDVIEQEGLQAHADAVGRRLVEGLTALAERHPLIGDVRGRGLFLGLELVRDRHTMAPAPRHATYVVERMKERGILLSTEGPFHTVVKMKPPLVFTERDAELVLRHLDAVLAELH